MLLALCTDLLTTAPSLENAQEEGHVNGEDHGNEASPGTGKTKVGTEDFYVYFIRVHKVFSIGHATLD